MQQALVTLLKPECCVSFAVHYNVNCLLQTVKTPSVLRFQICVLSDKAINVQLVTGVMTHHSDQRYHCHYPHHHLQRHSCPQEF